MRIGLTGGIGSGKSEVARIFADCGAYIIDADHLAREAVAPGTRGLEEVAKRWPHAINSAGELDRAVMAEIIFADDEARKELNGIVHPAVRELGSAYELLAKPEQPIVHVVPLLFEEGFAGRCDYNVLVIAPESVRIKRVQSRDGLEIAAIEARMARQIDPRKARTLADEIIENSGDLKELERQAKTVYKRLLERED